jgi:hypothetical protein
MPIITIYQRASGSGQEVAEAVAKTLGIGSLNCCLGSKDTSCAQRGEQCRESLPVYSRPSATLL